MTNQRTIQNVLSGNYIQLRINDQVYGMCQGLSDNASYGLEPISGIGSILVQENVPTMFNVSLSLSTIKLRTNSLMALMGNAYATGASALTGLVFDIVEVDNNGNELIRYVACSVDSAEISTQAHRVIAENVSLRALDRKVSNPPPPPAGR